VRVAASPRDEPEAAQEPADFADEAPSQADDPSEAGEHPAAETPTPADRDTGE
jgi:hypothetical protein